MLSTIITYTKLAIHGFELVENTSFMKNLMPETFKLAKANDIDIYVVSEKDAAKFCETENVLYACGFLKCSGYKRIYLIKEHLINAGFNRHCLDFVILHEIGHIVNDSENEQVADNYAINHLAVKYGKAEAIKIYKMSLLTTYGFDTKSQSFLFLPDVRYSHRKKWLSEAAKETIAQ